ncbi:hypothetical protein SARC_05444 [Sphaeroforma arctica JP610]|uniref:Uncharacterized protein n=1 Tax=Sphaeroforma arctica JP610 TaxID=667725 RepID=A0A0L0FZK6_9EUKA|nr:hypothetical protein SARC_05444 [Sphaeroforma arctica JP610]KNC82272.1 hypothetical protein SARC_05444 [Sphaeroforma arctica JP610]|eukprot:XP_014156174.1 hypothetical protein SARC_05444 [Sphaeroforma arctica JP610]
MLCRMVTRFARALGTTRGRSRFGSRLTEGTTNRFRAKGRKTVMEAGFALGHVERRLDSGRIQAEVKRNPPCDEVYSPTILPVSNRELSALPVESIRRGDQRNVLFPFGLEREQRMKVNLKR